MAFSFEKELLTSEDGAVSEAHSWHAPLASKGVPKDCLGDPKRAPSERLPDSKNMAEPVSLRRYRDAKGP